MVGETPYEIRCLHCNTSFAPETKVCVHCGRPLRGVLGALLGGGGGAAATGAERARAGGAPEPLGEPEESEVLEGLQGRSRNIVWVVTAILAAILSGLRTCAG